MSQKRKHYNVSGRAATRQRWRRLRDRTARSLSPKYVETFLETGDYRAMRYLLLRRRLTGRDKKSFMRDMIFSQKDYSTKVFKRDKEYWVSP